MTWRTVLAVRHDFHETLDGCSSVGRALVSKTRCRAFESLLPCEGKHVRV